MRIITMLAAAAALTLGGCSTTSMSGSTYTGAQLQKTGALRQGVVIQVRNVTADRAADSQSSMVAGAIGGVIGAAMGNTVGAGKGRQLATVVGTAAGAAIGSETAKASQRVAAWEIVVELAGGGAVPIAQEADGYPLRPGQRVYVIEQNGRHRVVPAGYQ